MRGELLPLDEIHREVFRTGQHVHDRDFTFPLQGRPRRMRAGGHLLRDEEGQVVGSVVHVADVTDRHLLEDRMRRMERFIGTWFPRRGTASRDQEPVKRSVAPRAIVGGALGRRRRPGDRRKSRSPADRGPSHQRRSGEFPRFRLGRESRSRTYRLSATVEKIVQLIRPTANRQNVTVEFQLPPEGLPLVPLDGSKFEQVILNLVLNALDEMPQGGT